MLRNAPGFAAVVILTLALGIGATTTIFTVVNGVLLKPLPFADQDELVGVWTKIPTIDGIPVSSAQYFMYRDENRVFVERTMSFAVRTSRSPASSVLPEVQAAVWAVHPNLPPANVQTLDRILSESMARTSFTPFLLAIAAAVALALSAA